MPRTHAAMVSLPRDYVFNREVRVDVLEIKDSAGRRYSCLNIVDMGTTVSYTHLTLPTKRIV